MARRKSNDSKSTSAASSSSSSWQNLRMSQSARRDQKQSDFNQELPLSSTSGSGSGGSDNSGTFYYGHNTAEKFYSDSTSTAGPSQQSFIQPTASSSSSIASTSGEAESSRAQYDVSASSSSSSSTSVTTQAKSPRARVSMACIHCRSRRIRCDGSHPTCSTCFRLGRVCVYESISELENIMAREKKKRSKEAKQARLNSFAGLGIPIPSRSASMSTTSSQQLPIYTRSISSGSASASASSSQRLQGASAVGVIRDSRLARQVRSRPYAMQSHQHQQQQNQYITQPAKQEDKSTLQQGLMPPQRRENMHSQSQRRRGVTLDSIPTTSPPLHQDQHEASMTGTAINVTSLSQPTTPEAAYSLHASMLSRELSPSQTHSPAEVIHERPFTGSSVGRQDPHDYPLTINAPSTTLTPDDSNVYRTDQYVSEVDYTNPSTAFTSAVPSATSRSSVADSTLANSFQSNIYPPGTSPSIVHRAIGAHPDLEQQLALRRRSSFDVGDFWRRTSVADAAVVNFFDRVVHAKGSKRGEDEEGTVRATSTHPIYSTSPMQQQEEQGSYSSTLTAAHAIPSAGGPESNTYYPTYSNLQEVMMNTVPLDTPYTALTSNPTPLTFQHPFAIATSGGEQPEIQAHNRVQSNRDDVHLQDPYQNTSAIQYPSQAFPPSMYHQSMTSTTSAIPALPSPTSSSSSTSFSRLRAYSQQQPQHQSQQQQQYQQQQLSPNVGSMTIPSFSTTSRLGQRAPPPHQLDLGNLAAFETHRHGHLMHTDGSSSTYATAESIISPHHQHRMISSSTPGSATYSSSHMPASAGPYFSSAPSVMSGSGSLGAAPPPLPTPMTELSSNMMAMAPPSNYMVSPSGMTRTLGERSDEGGDEGESSDPYYAQQQQQDQYQQHQHQHWQ